MPNSLYLTLIKIVGIKQIKLKQLPEEDEYDKVTVIAQVIEVNEPQTVGLKQEFVIADKTGTASVSLWEHDVNMLMKDKSYQMNKLVVRIYMGKTPVSCIKWRDNRRNRRPAKYHLKT